MSTFSLRPARPQDLDALVALETLSFEGDRLSRRSLRRWLLGDHGLVWVAETDAGVQGYCLVIVHRGTRLARLYSLAVHPSLRGRGVARALLAVAEKEAVARGCFTLRLEVRSDNLAAIALYTSLGYRRFGMYNDYYEDHSDAVRMHKRIRHFRGDSQRRPLAWLAQSTPFTCGPAALMMAMAGLDEEYRPGEKEELRLWREATTIFMTAGHGGCHPLGLALAAQRRGFASEVWVSQRGPLFVDGVRDANKKRVMRLVHEDFVEQASALGLPVHYQDITQAQLVAACEAGHIPLLLISTYRLDGKKAPHWVVLSGHDDACFYIHDPDPDSDSQGPLDCQYLPLDRQAVEQMSRFGQSRLRAVVLVKSAGAGEKPPESVPLNPESGKGTG